MLDSIYHMKLNFLKSSNFWRETSKFCHILHSVKLMSLHNVHKSVNHKWFIDCIA